MEPPAGPKRRGPQLIVRATGGGSSSAGGAAAGGGGGGGGAGPARGCLRHPAASALFYMALGGLLTYCFLALPMGSGGSGGGGSITSGAAAGLDPPQPMAPDTLQALAAAARLHRKAAARAAARAAREAAALCEDTCFKARDGVCDDGRHPHNMSTGREAWVLCDLGTDCADCGPWHGVRHSAAWREAVGPVEFLRRRGTEVRVRKTALDPRFWFAYTNPAHDVDVSGAVRDGGVLEMGISHIFYHVLHKPCAVDGRGLLVDVGGNFGWFSVFSAMLGCNVVAFEPVPQFRAFFEYNLARNNLQGRVQIRPTVAVAYPGRGNYTVVVPQRGIWGTAGIDGSNIDEAIDNEGAYQRLNVSGEALDQVLVGRRVDLLKVDVEGYEPDVMQGAAGLVSEGRVDNIVMEYSPHVFEKNMRWQDTPRTPAMLVSLLDANFSIGQIARKEGDQHVVSWGQPLGMLGAVTRENLRHDLEDTRFMTDEGMVWGREPCPAMIRSALIVDGMPERFHPKSFRSVISFNTNIWASRNARLARHLAGPPVGIIPLDVPMNASWFPPADRPSDLAVGGRSCQGLRDDARKQGLSEDDRASLLVPHHCRCGEQLPCKKAEDVADECARRGETPFQD